MTRTLCGPCGVTGSRSLTQVRGLSRSAEVDPGRCGCWPPHSVTRQQLPDLFHELLARREVRHIDVEPGVNGLGDPLPPVQCYLRKPRVGEHPELAGGDGVRYQVGNCCGIHPFVDSALIVRSKDLADKPWRGDFTKLLWPVAVGLAYAGANPARAQHADPDGKPGHLHRHVEVFGDGDYGVLGRVVDWTSSGDQTGNARRVDDVAFALPGQQRQEDADPVDDAPQVDAEHPLPGRY